MCFLFRLDFWLDISIKKCQSNELFLNRCHTIWKNFHTRQNYIHERHNNILFWIRFCVHAQVDDFVEVKCVNKEPTVLKITQLYHTYYVVIPSKKEPLAITRTNGNPHEYRWRSCALLTIFFSRLICYYRPWKWKLYAVHINIIVHTPYTSVLGHAEHTYINQFHG